MFTDENRDNMRPMIEEEDKYTFRQSRQISNQCGLIGHLRADMATTGISFYSRWEDFRADLKTDEFRTEFDSLINSLREEGDILHSYADLVKYCNENPGSKMSTDRDYYGVRIDTKNYAYLLRLNPNEGDYNLYCYCYRRDWLNSHMERARRGIRFIDPNYKEQFRLPDGDKVRIVFSDGKASDRVCRYIDDYHVEVGDNLYHICEFAERMEHSGTKVVPLRSSLPEKCFVYVAAEDKIGIVYKGEMGYRPAGISPDNVTKQKGVDYLNDALCISKAQAEAMKAGSMFGWDTPAADPKNYDAQGMPIRPKARNNEAR